MHGFAPKVTNHAWIGSVQGAVATWSVLGSQNRQEYRPPITDQVANASCTDPIQVAIALNNESRD